MTRPHRPVANVILWLYRGGQVHSFALLRDLLDGLGWDARLVVTGRQSPHEGLRADVNLFSSEIHPAWLKLAPVNVLLANAEQDVRQSSTPRLRPERFAEVTDQLRYLRLVDEVWAKTRQAEAAYARNGLPVRYVGFTARDRFLPGVAKDEGAGWLCVVGDNFGNKSLRPLLHAWARNPDFPRLTVVLRPELAPFALPPELPNLVYVARHVPDAELREMQNRCAVHVCASVMEGFGHAIAEAMNAAALLIAADAPPMSEHVGEDRGALFGATDPTPHAFAAKWSIDEALLEATVRRVIGISADERASRGRAARAHYLAADAAFRLRFKEAWGRVETASDGRGPRAGRLNLAPALPRDLVTPRSSTRSTC